MQGGVIVFSIAVTTVAYKISNYLYKRYKHPLVNVVLLGAAIVICSLLASGLTYEDYIPGRDIMTFLLGPATVALAVPLYKNKDVLRAYALSIISGVAAGSILSISLAVAIAKLGGLPREIVISIGPKSATIPFAVEIARIAGGDPSLTTAFVVATGTFGSVFGLGLLSLFNIKNPVARGLAMGTVSHGQGVAMALTEGEQEGAMAGVAMGLAGVFTAVAAPFLIPLFL